MISAREKRHEINDAQCSNLLLLCPVFFFPSHGDDAGVFPNLPIALTKASSINNIVFTKRNPGIYFFPFDYPNLLFRPNLDAVLQTTDNAVTTLVSRVGFLLNFLRLLRKAY